MAAVRLRFETTMAIILDVLPLGQDVCQKPTLQIPTPPQIHGLLSITHNLTISNV